jgi:MFS family permease
MWQEGKGPLTSPDRKDIFILFTTRIIRLFCYGFLSVVLALYLIEDGLSEKIIGLIFSLTLAGDAGISLWLTTSADRIGRKRTLIIGASLMVGAGFVFIFTHNPIALACAAIIGVISPSGNEIGPFLSVEQAALSHLLPDEKRTQTFAWYALAGSLATATGALSGGWLAQGLQQSGFSAYNAYRVVLAGYALGGFILIGLFLTLSKSVEVTPADKAGQSLFLGLHRSKSVVLRLSGLFAIDAFAGALLVQSLLAYWFHVKYGVDTGVLGSIFFGANILAGLSALFAARIARRFGLINTMVFTHVPSNILLILVPLMPNLPLAIGMLLARFSISQMDVPTRQSYTMAVVAPNERSAASGITTIARSVGAALSPSLTGYLMAIPFLFSAPFFLSGGLKIVYDLLLYRSFRGLRPPEENGLRR